ncbi:tRNA preQ1(34) S-adenosylmethionine ribosyltransferase-isomerase QueA [Planctomicrobium sp. SH661]|uniref:tRNA preQ1(34) S-adenosylmethionine ribosyltransferase-isomerase QueA n=1 Tax=Planctomicrobium sp. SH661 TaxID=3448124 RepID=UPI003F5BDEEC
MPPDESIHDYDYHLPEELIAQQPSERRDASRLMVIDRKSQSIVHRQFHELPDLLAPHDLLVMNNTRVVPARLFGVRSATGGKWEGLFLREEPEGRWRIIGQTRGTLQPGEQVRLTPGPAPATASLESVASVELLLEERQSGGEWIVRPLSEQPTFALLERFGTLPLPHYMHRDAAASDWERYQTTYAEKPGAVAAPTAGLHFTPEIFERCRQREIQTAKVTLHVGLGTFRPVSADHLKDHRMHHEWCELPAETVQAISHMREQQGRLVAVGTTSVRTLETVAARGPITEWQGETDLFIRPPFQFRAVDMLITNFHLPKSTLLVLVCTFAGRELMLRAYEEAIRERYRFYSYGDAMLIL